MKKGTIVSIVGVIISVVATLTLVSKYPINVLAIGVGVAVYLLGKKLNEKKK